MEKPISEIMAHSQYFDGEPPESWELVTIRDNGVNYIRYYRDPEGNYRHVAQKRKKGSCAKTVTWEDECKRTFAARVYPKRRKKRKA